MFDCAVAYCFERSSTLCGLNLELVVDLCALQLQQVLCKMLRWDRIANEQLIVFVAYWHCTQTVQRRPTTAAVNRVLRDFPNCAALSHGQATQAEAMHVCRHAVCRV